MFGAALTGDARFLGLFYIGFEFSTIGVRPRAQKLARDSTIMPPIEMAMVTLKRDGIIELAGSLAAAFLARPRAPPGNNPADRSGDYAALRRLGRQGADGAENSVRLWQSKP